MKVKSPPRLPNPKADKAITQKSLAFTQVIAILLLTCVATFILTIKVFLPALDFLRDWAIKHGHNALKQDVRTHKAYLKLPLRLVQSLKPSELPKLNIDIKFKHLTKLHKKRDEALAKGILIQGLDDFVPASIRIGDRTTKVKLRLKGDWTDHLEREKWSFRVRVRGKEQIFGMRRFSIQNPKVRGYQGELLFQETLRKFGVLVPRYFFVDVVVNGDSVGIMALEEHFSKELLESNGRRESVIIRFDESLLWEMRASQINSEGKINSEDDAIYWNYKNSTIDAFQSSRIAKSESLSKGYSIGVGLLRGFVNGSLSASEVFDVELMGHFLGVSEFWGSKHSIMWHNLRFYLNPICLKLEPIGFDADLRALAKENEIIAQKQPIVTAILKDPKIFEVYRETVQLLAKEILGGGSHQKELELIEQNHLADLRREFYLLEKYPYKKLKTRTKYLLTLSRNGFMEDKKPPEGLPTLIHAFRIKDDNGFHLELANATPHEVEVRSINWIDTNGNPSFEFQPLSRKSFPILLEPTPIGSLPKIQRISYRNPSAAKLDSLEISAAFPGQKLTHKTAAISYSNALTRSPVPESTPDEQLSRHDFLKLDNPKKSIVVQPGIWHVSGSLVIPAGFTLKILAGTTLKFSPNEGLFSHGPLYFHGTSDRPIILEGISSKNHGNSWQGITVLNANSHSVWSHVIVRDTAGLSRLGWVLTGGVTFYKSDIRMNHCRLKGNLGEDALNIIHSKFELTDIEILESTSDGFDADFADGEIKNCLFKQIGKTTGGDAVDISGSEVLVTGCRFLNISDKALSVGEGSRMKASKLDIRHVGTGAASKDGSFLNIIDSSITDARVAGLMAYVKKPEYGPGSIEAKNITFLDTIHESRVQRGSNISINEEQMETEDVDVEALYETIMKPRSRK